MDDKIDNESCSKVNIDNEVVRKYLIHKNDILIALSGSSAGKIAFVAEEPAIATYANQRVGIIRTFDIDPLELFVKLKSGMLNLLLLLIKAYEGHH